jgi:hypothetical protein
MVEVEEKKKKKELHTSYIIITSQSVLLAMGMRSSAIGNANN